MMAVVPPFPSASKVRSWARSEPTVFRPGPKSPCKSSRSSQHPSQSLISEATSAQNTNNAKARKMSQHNGSSAAMDHHAVLGWKERRDSTSMLKRSYSTPAVKTMSSSVSSDQSSQPSNSGEKRRNKLGYHRTSIACTHCRRRKIRCIVSVDMENRCINCVRLKKDCSFQPVDQLLPPPSDHRHDSIQGQPIVPILASNSPALAIGGVNLPNGSVQDELRRARMPEHSRSIPVLMSDGSSEFSTDYEASGISNQGGIPWTSSAPGTATMANANDMGMRWQQMESPAGDSFSSFGPGSTGVPAWSSGTSGSVSGEDWPWTPSIPSTTRSMSFSGEFLPGQGSQMTPCQGLDPGSAGYSELFSNSMNAAAIHGTVMHTNTGLQAAPGILGQAAWGPDAFRKPRVDFGNWQFPNSGDGTHL